MGVYIYVERGGEEEREKERDGGGGEGRIQAREREREGVKEREKNIDEQIDRERREAGILSLKHVIREAGHSAVITRITVSLETVERENPIPP